VRRGHVAQRRPRAQRAVADDQLGRVQPAALHRAQHLGPGLAALAVAVVDRQQLLDPVLAHADHHQQAQPIVLAQAHRHVHAVDEQVRVAHEVQPPRAKARVLALPLLGQAADRRRRQAGGVLAEQALQRGPEVPGRQPAQAQDRQHVGDLRRAACVARQDPRTGLQLLAALRVDTAVIDARRPDRQRARPDRHAPLLAAAVAHHQPATVLVALVLERRDVLVGLRAQRRRDHPTRALAREPIERRHDVDLVALKRGPANIHHWRAFLPAFAGVGLDQPGRYAALPLKAVHNIRV